MQNAYPNAYTLAIAGKRPFVMLNTALIELLTEAELQCVIAHELGHLKCDHGVWLTIGNVLASGTMNFLPVVSSAVEEALFKWMRAAELTCDRCGSATRLLCMHKSIVCYGFGCHRIDAEDISAGSAYGLGRLADNGCSLSAPVH